MCVLFAGLVLHVPHHVTIGPQQVIVVMHGTPSSNGFVAACRNRGNIAADSLEIDKDIMYNLCFCLKV